MRSLLLICSSVYLNPSKLLCYLSDWRANNPSSPHCFTNFASCAFVVKRVRNWNSEWRQRNMKYIQPWKKSDPYFPPPPFCPRHLCTVVSLIVCVQYSWHQVYACISWQTVTFYTQGNSHSLCGLHFYLCTGRIFCNIKTWQYAPLS